MKLIHLATLTDSFGLTNIFVLIDKKIYTYRLKFKDDVRKFVNAYQRGFHGKAIAILKRCHTKA